MIPIAGKARLLEPQEVQKRLDELRQRAEEARQEMLAELLQENKEEIAVYHRRRAELEETSPDDPRIAVLTARLGGGVRLDEFLSAATGGGGTIKPAAGAARSKKAKKNARKP